MQRRNILLVLAAVAAALVLVCGVGGGAALLLIRRGEQSAEGVAVVETSSAPTPSNAPVASPTARPPTVTPVPSVSATAQSSAPATPAPDATAQPSAGGAGLVQGLTDASAAELAANGEAPRYDIAATFAPADHRIVGSQTVTITNTEDVALDSIFFRLYVNAPHYNEGGISVDEIQVDGVAAESTLTLGDTALEIRLPRPLAPGEQVVIAMRFETTIPTSGGGYGIFNESNGVFTLYNWHPELAVYEAGGWLLNPVSDQGDPTNTDVANYTVALTAPDEFVVVTGGVTAEQQDEPGDGGMLRRVVAPLTRNLVIVASDRYEQVSREADDTLVSSYYLPGDRQGGEAALETAARSLEVFEEAFGPYPYAELDVAQIDMFGAAGMESTGLIMIASNLYDPRGSEIQAAIESFPGAVGADQLAFTTAHEVAHEWWYGVVGSDAYEQPWLDESLTNWSAAYYVDQVHGADAGGIARDLFVGFGYRQQLQEGDVVLDQPVDQFSGQEYGSIVYGKGALMYDVLREELGDDTFFEFLRRYYAEQQFDRADGTEWLATLNQVARRDMTPFYRKWVEGSAVTSTDLPPGGPLSGLLVPAGN